MDSPDKVKLTRAVIDKISPPSSGRIFRYDSGVTGLCICVTAAGTRTWYLYRKVNRKPIRLKLGRYPEVPPDYARQLATEAAGRMAGGEDIHGAKQDLAKLDRGLGTKEPEFTWGALFGRYLDEYAKDHKKTWREDEANNRRYLADWQQTPLVAFTRQQVADKHRAIGANATTTANRVLSLVSKVFSFADEIGLWELRNPCKGIKKFKERSRDRFVQPSEMPMLLTAVRGYKDATLRDFFLTCLMTGARRLNVMQMKWEELSLGKRPADSSPSSAGKKGKPSAPITNEAVWRIPDTKSGNPVVLPLSAEVQTILWDRKKICGSDSEKPSEYVFPGRYGRSHLKEPKTAWKKILASAGLKNLKIHDLRRTLGSWQAAAGVSLTIIGKSLGHKTTTATAVYARLDLGTVREAVGDAVAAMVAIGSDQQQEEQKQEPDHQEPKQDQKQKKRKKAGKNLPDPY